MARTASKNVPPLAAVSLGHLDAHQPEFKQLFDDIGPQLTGIVHRTDVRADFLLGEFVDRVEEQGFFFAEDREGHERVGQESVRVADDPADQESEPSTGR